MNGFNLSKQLNILIGFSYILFVFAGVYKSAPYFSWISVDLTLLFGLFVVILTSSMIILFGELRTSRAGFIIPCIFCLFLLYALLSGFWSPSSNYYSSKSLRLVTSTTLAIIFSAIIISSSSQRLRYAGVSTFGLATVTAIEMIHQFRSVGGPWELEPFATNYLITGRMIGFGIILALSYVVLYNGKRSYNVISFLGIVLMIIALLVSGARGPIVSIAMASVFIFISSFIKDTSLIVNLYSKKFIAAIAGSISVILYSGTETRAFRRFSELLGGGGRSVQLRLQFYEATVNQLELTSLIFGRGWASWPVYMGYGDYQHYPHNIFLETMFELGLIGLLLLIFLLVYPLFMTINQWMNSSDPTYVILISLFIYTFLNAMVTGDINENRYLFAVIGLMAYSSIHTNY